MEKQLIVIAGPTACGKTAVSIKLAKKIGGEIISADSMQVYKFMDIGTAKILEDEKEGVKHYLIDELYPDEEYSAAVFKNKAKEYSDEIYQKGKIPILAGGTGFYINAFVNDTNFDEIQNDYTYRNELQKIADEKGGDFLFAMLEKCDPKSCKAIHPNNVKKVIRALEYFKLTGKPISEHNEQERLNKSPYNVAFFILNMDRELLYERINKRIDIMLENGLVSEVSGLLEKYSPELVSMQGLGYKEIVAYLNGKISFDEAVYILKRDTRHFAKRQLTWFKHQAKDAKWIDMSDGDIFGATEKMFEFCREKFGKDCNNEKFN